MRDEGDAEMEKSCSGGVFTTRLSVAEWLELELLLVPVTVSV